MSKSPVAAFRTFPRFGLLLLSFLSVVCWPASAQLFGPPETIEMSDSPDAPAQGFSNGVNLYSGEFSQRFLVGSIGGQNGLSSSYTYQAGLWNDKEGGVYQLSSTRYLVQIEGAVEEFTLSGGTYSPTRPSVATLVSSGSGTSLTYTYTGATGAIAQFAYEANPQSTGIRAKVTSITRPDGEVLTYTNGNVQSTLGYQYRPADNNSLINLGYEYCDSSVVDCAALPSASWPSGTVTDDVTNAEGETTEIETSYASQGGPVSSVKFTSPEGVEVTVNKDTSGRVTSINRNGGTWTYTYSTGTPRVVTETAPSGRKRVSKFDTNENLIEEEIIPSGASSGLKTTYTYDSNNALDTITYPEGNKTDYAYDTAGRITEIREIAKPSSGLPDSVTSYAYTNCLPTNRKICGKPVTATNERGQVTRYEYSPSHGGITRIRYPRPSPSADWPVQNFIYTQVHAWYRTSSAATQVQAPTPVWRLFEARRCSVEEIEDDCSTNTGSDVAIQEYAYETGNASTPSNANLVSITNRSGDSSVSLTSSYTYDTWGRVTYTDGPLAGNADRQRYDYDRMQRMVRAIAPDPDGAGALQHQYMKVTYNDDGQPTVQETGRVNAYTGTQTFVKLANTANTYNSFGQVSTTALVDASNVTQQLSQLSYDNEGRVTCTARRMDTATFSSLPASACSQTSSGFDRISQTTYDSYGRAYQFTRGFATSAASTEEISFTNNSLQATVQDGNGNLTTLEYDGHDRLTKVRFPNKTGTGSSTTDFQSYTYKVENALSTPLIDSTRLRDGQVVSYTYDGLSRVTNVNAPGSVADIAATYDLLGNRKTLVSNGQTLTYSWDALGRMISEQGSNGTISYQYDSAGRRSRLTYPDGFYVTYEYNTLGAVTQIRENGTATLATYAYDHFGRRTSITRGNGIVTSLGYNGALQLSDLDFNLPVAPISNQQADFSYNPAGQITQKSISNDSFIMPSPLPASASSVNGLNQLANIGALTATYDDRGNMTSDGQTTFGYDIANRLTSVSGGPSLAYDPASRLSQVAGSTTTNFVYSGSDMIAEYDTGGNVLRRYVHGPGIDEPIVWYEGASVSSSTRRHLVADERGSVVLVSDDSGGVINMNLYDEYGVPRNGNVGRFQYTGQIWLEEAGVYHYKARMYHADIGRFLQTDPIGYQAGLNLYAYVNGDPINHLDGLGLFPHALGTSQFDRLPKVTVIGIRIPVPRPDRRFLDELSRRLADEALQITRDLLRSEAEEAIEDYKEFACDSAAVGAVGGADAYAGLGATVESGLSADLVKGQLSLFGSVGVGAGGTLQADVVPVAPVPYLGAVWNAPTGLGANITGNLSVSNFYGGGVSHSLVGSSPGETSVTVLKTNTGFSGNGNLAAQVSIPLTPRILDVDCDALD